MKDEKVVLEEIRKEYQVIRTRLQKLEFFMITDEYRKLAWYMRETIQNQRSGMTQYCEALFSRINQISDSIERKTAEKSCDRNGLIL